MEVRDEYNGRERESRREKEHWVNSNGCLYSVDEFSRAIATLPCIWHLPL
jgi:hypothetical protein